MPFIKEAISYFVALYPSKYTNTSADQARINIYCKEEFKLYVIFQKEPLPANSYDANNKIGVAYVDINRYPDYIDLVRNEKPISVTFNPDATPPVFVVFAAEPVGEEEGST